MTADTTSTPRAVSRDRPCAICDGDHKCSRKPDGMLFCGRRFEAQPGFKFLGNTKCGTWGMFRAEGDPVLEARRDERQSKNGNGHHRASSPIDWNQRTRQYANAMTDEARRELADALGLPRTAIGAIDSIGWNATEECWTFPERDARGNVVGINRRYRNGKKKVMAGGHRGLYVPEFWNCGKGPLFLVEGASDTLTLAAIGHAVIGRPSNTGGVEHAVELLKEWPADRPIIVVGEFDPKETGEWPGLSGAKSTAASISKALNRPIGWALAPNRAKDARQWALQRITNGAAWDALDREFVDALKVKLSKPEDAETQVGYQFSPIDSATFDVTDYRQEWLVKRCLVRGQVGVIGGGKKSLKTTIAVDLALSLGTGKPFLGQFEVYRKVRVALISGESGQFTLQETARRVAAAKGIELAEADVIWDFSLPKLSRPADLATLAAGLKVQGCDVLIFDPLYLALLTGSTDVNAGNLYEIGPLLANFTRACLAVGVTPIILHHFRKASPVSDDLDLNALAFAGIGEFARQWILIGRREPYVAGSGIHKLTMVVGGSAGQSGSWSVNVDEGQLADDFTGRKWEVTVEATAETKKVESDLKAQKTREVQDAKERDWESRLMQALDKESGADGWAIFTRIRQSAGLNSDQMGRAVFRLKEQGLVEEGEVGAPVGKKAKKPARGLRRPNSDREERIIGINRINGTKPPDEDSS
jgi:hypothetical protein